MTRVDPVLLGEIRARFGHGPPPASRELLPEVRARSGVLGRDEAHRVASRIRDEIWGAGPLQPLLEDPSVTDVLVNGEQVWCDRGTGLHPVDLDLGGPGELRALAVRLAATAGQRLDDAAPVVDGRLPDGTRLHAVLPPVAEGGPLLSLRVVRSRAFSLPELLAAGTVDATTARVLAALVRGRANMLVSGATGSGKTTLLAALLGLVPGTERLVCIEEAPELAVDHPHLVRLVARRANVEGAGAVGLADLVRHALRMRPDRLVLGECRGAEVREVLAALNTGHDGGCATVHANTAEDLPARLDALGALAGMSHRAVVAQAAAALDAVVHLRREGPLRYVAQVGRVVARGERLVVEPVLAAGPAGVDEVGPSWPAFAERWGTGAEVG